MTKKEKALVDEIQALIQAGLPMSNWLYNRSQQPNFAIYQQEMRTMTRRWDDAVSRARPSVKPPAGAKQ